MNKLIKSLILILIITGVIYNISFVFLFDKKYPEKLELNAIVEVISLKIEKKNSNCYTVKIKECNLKSAINTKVIIYTKSNINYVYGDIISISGNFSKATIARNYKGFDYRNYLKQSKIYGSVYVSESKLISHRTGIFEKVYILKKKFYDVLSNIYNSDEQAFLKGILLGDSNDLNDEIKENFRNSSMSHVLAISGMHISYVVLGIQILLDQLINSRKLKNYILIVILFFFVIITGASSSCVRACIMSVMILLSQNIYRNNNFYVSILFTFIVLIFINPYNIFSVGMWLSFGGTLGIVLFHKFIKRFIECRFKLKSKFVKSFLEIFLISFSAQILILPIMIYCFNTVSLTFFISNMMIYFLIGPILALGYISMIIGVFFCPIGKFIAIFEKFFIACIFKIAELCSKLPFSKIFVVTPDLWMLIAYYIVIVLIIFMFNRMRFKCLRFVLSDNLSKSIKKNYKKIIIIFLIIILFFKILNVVPSDLKIYFIDVGQR